MAPEQSESIFTPDEWDAIQWALEVAEREVRDELDSGWSPALGKRNNAIVSASRKLKETCS